jgi:hypothetical protein
MSQEKRVCSSERGYDFTNPVITRVLIIGTSREQELRSEDIRASFYAVLRIFLGILGPSSFYVTAVPSLVSQDLIMCGPDYPILSGG